MQALLRLQRAFADDLWRDDLRHMQGLILDDGLSAERRFNVYRNNFQSVLINAMAATYPVVEQLVGKEFFTFMSDRYLRAHPSKSGDLHQLGSELEHFVRHLHAVSKLPYLADVARLEWAYHSVYHSAYPDPFEPDALQQAKETPGAALRFDLGPACRLLHSPYPLFRIWKVNQDGYTGDQSVNLNEGPESILVVRPELEVELWRIDPAEAALLNSLVARNDLDAAVQDSLKCSGDFDLTTVLRRFLIAGVLTRAKN